MQEVHPSGKPIYLTTLNANAAITNGAAKLQNGTTGFLLSGAGLHIFQWDAGAVFGHQEFGNRVVANEELTTDRHATHVGGTLVASGVNPASKGMSPEAKLHAYYFDDDIFEIATQSEINQYGFMISNHSYGATTGWHRISGQWQWFGDESISVDEDYKAGFYAIKTKQLDEIAYLSPYHMMVWAAGNDRADAGNGSHPADCNGGTGYDCIIQQGSAKNVITVGGVDQVLNYAGPGSVPMPGFSSWGPTDDGRIKPDLVSDGASVLSTTNTGVDQYTSLGGTSMATATVSGALLLLQELHGKLNGGQWMRASTLKALAVHTTKEAGSSPGPDYSFGWGLLDVDAAARVLSKRDDINTFVIEGELLNDETHEWILTPQPNQKITATLVWTDPAGLPPSTALDPPYKMLVNDLDLRLSDANGAIHYPWVLDPGNPPGAAIRADNSRDNVEKIEFSFPELKPYTLRLSHKGYLLNDRQHYSLIITYTSTNTSRTLYWIGGSGNWNDPTHWSMSSGGTTANTTPNTNDLVIVDENSFSVAGNMTLASNITCESLKWYSSKDAGIDFNKYALTIGKELTLASSAFKKLGHGTFKFNSPLKGVINSNENFAIRPNAEFVAGEWTIRGNLFTDTLINAGGNVLVENAQITTNHFKGISAATTLKISKGIIQVEKGWMSDVSKLTINSSNATLIADGSLVVIQAPDLNWSGVLINRGSTSISGNLAIDSLVLEQGTSLAIGHNSMLSINKGINIQGQPDAISILTSTGTATISVGFHEKICADYVSVSNVNLMGDATINLGSNSTLQNATGWLQQNCDEVLFPDFSVRYACVNALTEFINSSTGNATSFHWNFGDALSSFNESNEQNPTHQFSAIGQYTISLTVSNGASSRTYSRITNVMPNTLPPTRIENNSEILFSSTEAQQYQWFENGEPIQGETNRMFPYGGDDGLYRVVLYDEYCNSPSEEFTISGIIAEQFLYVYPNPANEKLYFFIENVDYVQVRDMVGRSLSLPINQLENYIDVSPLSSGMYLLEVRKGSKQWTRRVMVKK